MDFKKIENLLIKFKTNTPLAIVVRKKTSYILKSDFGIKIDKEKIVFNKKTGDIFLDTDNYKKTLIFLNKEKIIEKINLLLEKKLIRNIR